jgi:hypothetical protein
MTWKDVDLKKRIARLRGADGRKLKKGHLPRRPAVVEGGKGA